MRDGQASVTAQRVAAHRLTFDRVPADYGDPGADEQLSRDVAGDQTVDPAGRMVGYLAARTAFFDRTVVAALAQGISQVVVAGAGYDGRAWRYAKPGVSWFEVDHPDTQADKLGRIRRLGLDTAHVSYLAADFAVDDVGQRLLAAGLDRSQPCLMMCEGVAAYLDEPVLAALLAGLGLVAAAGSRLVISVSASTGSPGLAARRAHFQSMVAALGEPVRSVITSDTVEPLLTAASWRIVPATDPPPGHNLARLAGLVTAEYRQPA